jgi:hypothetical protein
MTQQSGSPVFRYLGWGIGAVIVGGPMLGFLAVLSYGAFVFPLLALAFLGVGIALMAPYILAHLILSLLTSPWGMSEALEKPKPLPQQSQ